MSLKKYSLINRSNEFSSTPRELTNLRANNMSSRAGLGWALLDSRDSMLVSDAQILGYDECLIEKSIQAHSLDTHTLYLTMEPCFSEENLKRLLNTIESSSIQSIVIGCSIKINKSHEWLDWKEKWDGKVEYLQTNILTAYMSRGPFTAITSNRPWVTCVTTADISGRFVPINGFISEFGFKNKIQSFINETRAVICTNTIRNDLNNFKLVNNHKEQINTIDLSGIENFQGAFSHLVKENIYNVLLFCEMAELEKLVNKHLIDEVFHFITNSSHISKQSINGNTTLDCVRDWQITGTEQHGNCSCIHIKSSTPRYL